MLAEPSHNYSYENQDHTDLSHGPVRRRDLPRRRRYDVEDNARQSHPGRDPVLPQHYPDQVARPVANHSCVHVSSLMMKETRTSIFPISRIVLI